MKKALPVFVVFSILISGALVYLGAHTLADKALAKPARVAPVCTSKGPVHAVIIENELVTPAKTAAGLCDQLTIINRDDKLRELAFGQHEDHVPYDGVTEKSLAQGDSLT